jgi:hypothetical protein
VPAQRSRAPRVLSFSEREEISRGIAAGDTLRAIGLKFTSRTNPSLTGNPIAFAH